MDRSSADYPFIAALSFRMSLLLSQTQLEANANDTVLHNTLMVTSTIPVVDDAGANATSRPFSPRMDAFQETHSWCKCRIQCVIFSSTIISLRCLVMDSVQLFACNIGATNTTIEVSATARTPIQGVTRPNGTWKDWIPQGPSTDPLLQNVRNSVASHA